MGSSTIVFASASILVVGASECPGSSWLDWQALPVYKPRHYPTRYPEPRAAVEGHEDDAILLEREGFHCCREHIAFASTRDGVKVRKGASHGG